MNQRQYTTKHTTSQCHPQPSLPPSLIYSLFRMGLGLSVNMNNRGCDSDFLCFWCSGQWHPSPILTIWVRFQSSVLYLFNTIPPIGQTHCLRCTNVTTASVTPFDDPNRSSFPTLSPYISAIFRKTDQCILTTILSYVALEITHQLLRDHF